MHLDATIFSMLKYSYIKKTKACSSDEIHYLSHSPQMMVYLVVQLVEEFETDATKPDSLDIASNKVSNYQVTIIIHFYLLMRMFSRSANFFYKHFIRGEEVRRRRMLRQWLGQIPIPVEWTGDGRGRKWLT